MADEIKVKMSEFAEATQINNADDIIILQNGENKRVKSPILESKVINRTVEVLSANGGVALNLVNLKGVVATYANLPTTGLQVNDAYQVTSDGLVYTWSGTAFQPNGQGFKIQPNVNGVVEQGNVDAVSGGEVFKSNNVYVINDIHTSETARSAVPNSVRKQGLIIQYQTSLRVWEAQQYIHNILGNSWTNVENWEKLDLATSANLSILTQSKSKNGLQLRDYIDNIEVSLRNETNTSNYINPLNISNFSIFGFGYLSSDLSYNISLAYYNGTTWVNQPVETRYKNMSNALVFTFNYYQFLVKVTLKKWSTTYTSFSDSVILNKDIFVSAYLSGQTNRNDNYLISFPTSGDVDDYINIDKVSGQVNLKIPSIVPIINSNGNVVSIQNSPNAEKTYFIKRQEFLYVDIPLRFISGFTGGFTPIIQHGNYIASVTDERGTINKAGFESADENTVRIVLFAVGYAATQIMVNKFPMTPTKEQVVNIIDNALGGNLTPDQLVKASSFDAKNKLREEQLRAEYQQKTNDGYIGKWYGVQYTEQDVDNTIRINSTGDIALHYNLPIQSLMRRCVVKKNIVQYYLDADNSELKADGNPAKLDGSDGNVMVEIPEFFFKIEEDTSGVDKVVRIKISQDGFPDFLFSPKRYTSAYEATIDRGLNKLSSVCTTNFTRNTENIYIESASFYAEGTSSEFSLGSQKTALISSYTSNATNFRGGTNDSTLDSASGNQISRCQLGRPIANVRRGDIKPLLNDDEFIYLYDTHKVLWFLAYTEFARRNIQQPIQAKLPNDLTYGGLGQGSTVYPDYDAHANFYTPYGGISLLPCGVTNNLGNKSGEVYFKIQNAPVESEGDKTTFEITRYDNVWMPVMSYRGVEQYYGHIYKIADQINIISRSTGEYAEGHDGDWRYVISDTSYYYEKNPYLTNNTANISKLLWRGDFQSYCRYNKLFLGENGHLLPIDGYEFDYYTAYADCCEIFPQGENVLYPTFNGRIVSGRLVGYNFIVGHNYDSGTPRASDGTRLDCF